MGGGGTMTTPSQPSQPNRTDRIASATITLIITGVLALMMLSLVSCGDRDPKQLGDEEYKGATSGTATVRVVAEDPALAQSLPDHSKMLVRSADLTDSALQVRDAKPEQLGAPLVTPEEIAADPATASARVNDLATQQEGKMQKERESNFFSKLLSWSGWALLGAGGLYVARLLGVPGVQYLADPLVKKVAGKWINPILEKEAEAEKKIKDLSATVEGSVVARYGLRELDKLLGDDIKQKIRDLTKGEADSIEGVFKWLAKSHVSDSPEHDSNAVAGVVDWIKDNLATRGLVPEKVKELLA